MTETRELDMVVTWLHDNEDFTNLFVLEWLQTHPDLLRSIPTTQLLPSAPFVQQTSATADTGIVCPKNTGKRAASERQHYRRKDAAELCELRQSKLFMELVKDVTSTEFSTTRLAQRILEDCMLLVKAEKASIYFNDGGVMVSRLLDVVEGTGREQWPTCTRSEAIFVPMGVGIVGEAAQSGATINIPDAQKVSARGSDSVRETKCN